MLRSLTTTTTTVIMKTTARNGYVLRRSALTAAAFVPVAVNAFASSGTSAALTTVTPHGPLRQSPPSLHSPLPSSLAIFSQPSSLQYQTRLFSSRRGYDWDPDEDRPNEKNALKKAAEKVKSFVPDSVKKVLPSKWFQSDEEKRASIERKRRQNEISGALDQSLKDAPLGVRLVAKAAGKIFSKMATGLAETMEEQSRQMEDLLQDARSYIVADVMASNVLGEPISIGTPISQSSSTSVINGAKSVNVQASFEVAGSRSAGIATMVANGSGVQRLRLDVAGRSFEVNTKGGRPARDVVGGYVTGRKASKSGPKKGDIIDAEIIDAEYREK